MNEKNTPRDFFLHAGAFITLYFGAIALITLLFSVINYQFPDPLQTYYSDPYSGPMRFAIASLLVLVPLCVYLFYIIQSETRKNPERKALGVRKWLTYITLFVAGVTTAGDVIVLLNSFLGGELPTTFLLKIFTILFIMVSGFVYFFLDIKGYWTTHAEYSRYVGLGVLLAVLASIVGGMMLIGSPMTQRNLRIDNQEVMDLSNISQATLQYWQQTQTLPKDLAEIENDLTGYRVPTAPNGQPAYEYSVISPLSFKICATFLQASDEKNAMYSQADGFFREGPQWSHAAGHTCFTRTIDPALFKPQTGIPGNGGIEEAPTSIKPQ